MLVDDGTYGLSREAIGIAIRIHKKFGPGLLESAYLRPFAYELRAAGYKVDCEPRLDLVHENLTVEGAYRPDMIVNRRLLIEVKSVQVLLDLHRQQVKTYLKLADLKVGVVD